MELFRTNGVCARGIELEVENGIVKDVKLSLIHISEPRD